MAKAQDILFKDLLFNLSSSSRKNHSQFPFSRRDTGLDLTHLTNLFLPRIMAPEAPLEETKFREEVERIAQKHAERVSPYLEWRYGPQKLPSSPRECTVEVIDDGRAQVVLENFHYLNSFRPNSIHLGLTFRGHLASMVSFSEFDVSTMGNRMGEVLPSAKAMTLSRFYSFPWAPSNSTSHLISKGLQFIKHQFPQTDLVVSYLDPNVGFDGASYRASNFSLFGREHGTAYAFLDGDFVTQRDLIRRFGTLDPLKVRELTGQKLEVTSIPLQPLDVYAYFYDRSKPSTLDAQLPLRFEKPSSVEDYRN